MAGAGAGGLVGRALGVLHLGVGAAGQGEGAVEAGAAEAGFQGHGAVDTAGVQGVRGQASCKETDRKGLLSAQYVWIGSVLF